MGYTNVAHYPEGKQGWMEAGLPVEQAKNLCATYATSFFRQPKSAVSHLLFKSIKEGFYG